MAINIPPRNYGTFSELLQRWGRVADDLRFAIICGEIKPCIRLIGDQGNLQWEDNPEHGLIATQLYDAQTGMPVITIPRNWLYLRDPVQTGPFDCTFHLACDFREGGKVEDSCDIESWYSLPRPMSIADIETEAVFLVEEVARYEKKHGWASKPEIQVGEVTDKPLLTTERNTLLKLVIGMAVNGYAHDPSASKSTAPKEIADDLAQLGISMDSDTVRKYLKEAANTVLPANPRKS
jgi:hypothetical protein